LGCVTFTGALLPKCDILIAGSTFAPYGNGWGLVRFTAKSGHQRRDGKCLLCAKSGLAHRSKGLLLNTSSARTSSAVGMAGQWLRACLAATNKSLAKNNKSRTGGEATNQHNQAKKAHATGNRT
jgi:hypothetical protein